MTEETDPKAQSGDENGAPKGGRTSPLTTGGKAGVAILGLYLLFLLLLSLGWFSGLMFADTNDPDNANVSLAQAVKRSNTNTGGADKPSPNTAATPANANTAANTVQPSFSATGATPNRNATAATPPPAVNAARTPPANTAPTKPETKPAGTEANSAETDSKPGDKADEEINLRITRVISVDRGRDTFPGSLFSVYMFTSGGYLTADGYLFLVVLFAGMIGAIIRALIYLCWRVGSQTFLFPWVWYYIFQPFMGAGMALVVYAVVRGGFNGGAIGKGNVFTFAGLAFLTALFSDNAMAKLKLIAESLLVKVDPRPKTDDKKKNDGSGTSGGTDNTTPTTGQSAVDGASQGRTTGQMAADEPPV